MRIRLLLGILLLAGPAAADVTVTYEWSAPTHATDGQSLVGAYALTGYRIVVDGQATNLPASATRRDIQVADGETVSVSLKACNAGGCGASSETLSFTAPGAPPGDDDPPPPPPNEQLLWSGIGQGSTLISQGDILGGYDGWQTRVTMSLSGASGGMILVAYGIKFHVRGGYLHAGWRDDTILSHPTPILADRTHDIVFVCDRDADVWTMTIDGESVSVENAPACVADTWGALRVAGAGGTAEIAIYDVAETGVAPPPDPNPDPPPPPGGDGTPPSDRLPLWSGVGQGTTLVNYGAVLAGYEGKKSGVSIQVSGASAGKIIVSYPLQVSIVGGKARAKWYSRTREHDALLVHPAIINANRTHNITFECNKLEKRWTLIVDGVAVTLTKAPRCFSTAWGPVKVAGAGGTAAIELYDIP